MIPPSELTVNEYLILKYLNKFDSVSKEQILKHFSGRIDEIELRLNSMSAPEYGKFRPYTDKCYIIEEGDTSFDEYGGINFTSKNSFRISAFGRKVLQDYLANKKLQNRNMWLKNMWIPIIVSFATTVLTNYLLPRLLQILQ